MKSGKDVSGQALLCLLHLLSIETPGDFPGTPTEVIPLVPFSGMYTSWKGLQGGKHHDPAIAGDESRSPHLRSKRHEGD